LGTRHIIDTYLEAGQDPAAILSVGGGTRNRVWAQATSDLSQRSQTLREKTIGASFGDAFLAAVAIGDASLGDIARWNPVATEIRPDPATAEVYARRYAVFRDLYPRTRDLMARLEDFR
jgi:xylulokinase